MNVRKATEADLPAIFDTYAYARDFMRRTGNPNQWKNIWPPHDLLREDVRRGVLYAVCDGDELCGVFAMLPSPDPTYAKIDGAWLNDEPYLVIHRSASNGKRSGVMQAVFAFCAERTENIRIDTHEDNKVMQHVLDKNGFAKCGTIWLENGEPRVAYHKVVRNPNAAMSKSEMLAFLTENGVSYEITEHPAVFTMEDECPVALPYPECDAKNLFLRDDKKEHFYLITVKGDKRVDIKAFRREHGTRSLTFASPEDLMAHLGLRPGSVTPLGMLSKNAGDVAFYLDAAFGDGLIGVHPNENTATIWLGVPDLVSLIEKAGRQVTWVTLTEKE